MKRYSALGLCLVFTTWVFADENPIVVEGVVHGSLDEVWAAWTTKQGLESWLVPHADIDMKIGGKMLTHYDRKGKLGDPRTIENTIISFDPKRMLSIRVTKPPHGFPFPNAIKNAWSVLYLEKAGPDATKVTVVMLGYTNDEESLKMRKHFEWGNDFTLKKMQKYFEAKKNTAVK